MTAVLAVARPYLWRLLGAGALAVAAELAGVGLLATATWLLVSAAGQPPLAALTVAIVSVRALAVGRGGLRYAERLTGHDAVLRVLAEVRARLFASLVDGASPRRTRSGDLLSRMVSDAEAVQDLLLRVLVPGGAAVVVGAVTVAGVAAVAPPAAPVVAAGLLVTGVLLPLVAARTARRDAATLAPLRAAVATDAVDLTHGAADLAAFGGTDVATARARATAGRLARVESRLAAVGVALDAAGTLVGGAAAAGMVVIGVRSGVAPAVVAALAVVALAAVESSLALLGAARRWVDIRGPLGRVGELLACSGPGAGGPATGDGGRETADAPADPWVPAGPGVPAVPAGPVVVSARGLRVALRDGSAPALAGVDLDLPPGGRAAVVGPSGAGKSTLLAVLAGLREPDAGSVTVAGRPLSAYPVEQRHRLVGGLLADAHVFHATVRENLLLGRSATAAELDAACACAGLAEWLRELPAGYETVVGEDGGLLSGGQRQRLALARALLAPPRVLVLDEPTEGLDPAASARVLQRILAAAGRDTAVLLVTHHLSGLEDVDEIVVLDAGRVRQRGRHRDLVAQPGWYRDRHLAQRLAEQGYRALAGA